MIFASAKATIFVSSIQLETLPPRSVVKKVSSRDVEGLSPARR